MNETVEALNALSIFGPHHAGAYREHAAFVRRVLGADVDTRVGVFISEWALSGAPRVVILTGNAGTGKTALAEAYCRAIGATLPEADALAEVQVGRFVVKDLSGVPTEAERRHAVEHAVAIARGADAQLLLCANEGLLRAVLATADASELEGLLDLSLTEGAQVEPRIVVINMNRQRWTAPSIWHALVGYLTREELWAPCAGCPASACPIAANASALRESGPREAARTLIQFASGASVVTLRELLSVLAHAVSGGLSCGDVLERYERHGEDAFAADSGYFDWFLGGSLPTSRAERSALLKTLREAGLGEVADLEVDSWLRDATGAAREIRALATDEGAPVHSRIRTRVGPMTFAALGETISLSADRSLVDACLEDIVGGRSFLRLWRRRVFFEGAPYVGGRGAAFRRLSRFSYFGDLLELLEALRHGRPVAEERQQLVTGLNYLAAGFPSFGGHLIVPDTASLAARNPGSFRPPSPSLVHDEVPVERIALRLEDGDEIRALLDTDDVRLLLRVEREQVPVDVVVTPRLFQAIRESGDYRAPVGAEIPEMTELENFYAALATTGGRGGLRVVDPARETIRAVTLPAIPHG